MSPEEGGRRASPRRLSPPRLTDHLDEGPIIEQVVERVNHSYGPERLLATGRDVECLALARAVKFFIERRVFINGNRTVIFQ